MFSEEFVAYPVGISSETHYEVLSGLEEGDEIVTGSYRAISKDLAHNKAVTTDKDDEDKKEESKRTENRTVKKRERVAKEGNKPAANVSGDRSKNE